MNRTEIQMMIDIETLSTKKNAAIVSIGAVKFSIDKGIIDEFYTEINPKASLELGLSMDKDTMEWWKKQPKETLAWAKSNKDIFTALSEFQNWYGYHKGNVWANGVDFDMPIMDSSFKACNKPLPWHWWNQMDCRTMFSLFSIKTNEMERVGDFHNALGDCKTQTKYLLEILDMMIED